MKQLLLLPVALGAFAVLAWADPAEPLPAAEQAQRFHRNRKLVESMVDSGLLLASEESPFRRAEHCHDIAQCLADEIRKAAETREGFRAMELGEHLHSLLHLGVAGVLKNIRDPIDTSSPGQEELKRIRSKVADVTGPVEKQLRGLEDDENRERLRRVLRSVEASRAEVVEVVTRLTKRPAVMKR